MYCGRVVQSDLNDEVLAKTCVTYTVLKTDISLQLFIGQPHRRMIQETNTIHIGLWFLKNAKTYL